MSPNSETASYRPGASGMPPAANLPAQPLTNIAYALIALGLIGFAIALTTGLAQRAWEAFLVNLLFFLGIAQGGVVASAAFYLTQGRWAGRAHYRLAESFSGFLILGFVLFWFLLFGREWIFPWIRHPIPAKTTWLNVPFLFARDGIALGVMTLVSLSFLSASRSEEARKWAATSANILMPPPKIRRLAPAVCICFGLVYSLLSFDLVMSLSPLWHSTLFGWWFFAGAFWSAIVTMAFTAVCLRRVLGKGNIFTEGRIMRDLGLMVFAFSVVLVLHAVRAIHRDLVRRHSDGDLFHRGARALPAMGFHVVDDGVPCMGYPVCHFAGHPAQENARHPRHGGVARDGRHLVRNLRVGRALALAADNSAGVGRNSGHGRIPGRFLAMLLSRLEIGVGGRDGADRRVALMKPRFSIGLR